MSRTWNERRLDLLAADDRTVDAEAHVATRLGWDRTAEAGAEAAGHRGLHGELAGDAALPAHGPHGLEHGGRAAGVDGRAAGVVTLEEHREQVGHEAPVAGVAVLTGEPDLRAVEEVQSAGVGPVPEAEQDPGGDPGRDQLPAPDRERGHTDPAADQDRSG